MLTLTIDRTELGLGDLVISGAAGGAFVIETLGRPSFDARVEHAPDSAWVPGKAVVAAVRDQSTLPVAIHVFGSSSADLADLEAELADALFQFSYDVTLTVDGVARTWAAEPCSPSWGPELVVGDVLGHCSRASVVIPVNPEGA